MNKRAEIGRLVTALGEYYREPLSATQIAMYAEDLMCLEPAQLAQAILTYRNDPRNDRFPLPVKLKAMIGQVINPEDEAVRVAGRILEAISRIGPYDSAKAKAFIGDAGWAVVQSEGGWESICEIQTDDIPIRKAQWRNLAKSFLERPREARQENLRIESKKAEVDIHRLLRQMPKETVG